MVGRTPTVVIDPGPDDAGHIDAVIRAAGAIAAILLTHRHADHAAGASRLAHATRASIRCFDPGHDEERLGEGDTIEGGGVALDVLHTPGHAPDHLTFRDRVRGALFTGDTILGRGTSVVDPPEGDLTDYISSLERLLRLEPSVLYPGHGPTVWEGTARVREYLDHRQERELEVIRELGRGPRTPSDIVPAIYAAYPVEVHPAATRSVLAHLLKLEREGRVVRSGPPEDERFALVGSSS